MEKDDILTEQEKEPEYTEPEESKKTLVITDKKVAGIIVISATVAVIAVVGLCIAHSMKKQ